MTRSEYLSAVNEFLYQGELRGEVLFASYVALEQDAGRRHKWATCLQLETETKERLRPFLVRLGLSVAQEAIPERLGEFARTYTSKSWRQHMEELVGITDRYLEKFRAIEAAAPPDEREIAHSMVVHEFALKRFAQLELEGDANNSLVDVLKQLQYPLALTAGD